MRARWAEFRTPSCFMSASQKYINSSTPINLEKLSVFEKEKRENIILAAVSRFQFSNENSRNLILPLYCGKSSIFNQAAISKCGCLGNTMTGFICFLLNVENRKLHAIPANKLKDAVDIFTKQKQQNFFFSYNATQNTWTNIQVRSLSCFVHTRKYHFKSEQTLLRFSNVCMSKQTRERKKQLQSSTETDCDKVPFHELTFKCNIITDSPFSK